ncbi:MAG: hypothetical protein KME43_03010 [Myxacorys chilensis ATA2-1-KO14]|jgi:hypothetical protein|nr:hypothetical protein [Myxacorys chilensis ATA2-1-KO14]
MTKTSITDAKRRVSKRHFALGVLIATFFTLCFTARLVPSPTSDRAIFVSVAEYLLSGNQLYIDVYDNKDPLFFYAVSLQRVFGGIGEYLFELLMVVIATVSAYDISCMIECTHTMRKRILLIAVPLLVTGAFWLPGYTTLPGTALSLLACSFFLRKKMLLAGGCIGLVAFTKLIAFPLPAVFCLTYELILWDKQVSRENLKRLITGFTSVSAIVIVILLTRHELLGYLQTQQNNFFYSQSLLTDNSSFVNSFASHLRTMFLRSPKTLLLLFSLIASMGFSEYIAIQSRIERKIKAFLIGTLATCIISIIVLGLTGIWEHHLSLIYFSQTLMLICIAISINSKRIFAGSLFGIVIVVSAILLSGTPRVTSHYADNPMQIIPRIAALTQPSVDLKAFRSMYPNGTGFASLGQNTNVMPHGAANDRLMCPDFHQYAWYSPEKLRHILDCAKTAPTLVVDRKFVRLEEAPNFWPREAQKQILLKNWNDFVTAGERIIQTQYWCKNLESMRICSRERPKS